jgi:hypothetical protein
VCCLRLPHSHVKGRETRSSQEGGRGKGPAQEFPTVAVVDSAQARLRHMHEYALNGAMILEPASCAVVPAQFVRSWRQWLARPTEAMRPDAVDNTVFLCEHDRLVFDPNVPADFDSSIMVIRRTDWERLEGLYV